jgi:hypothetical protein
MESHPSDDTKAAILADCNPLPIDDVFLRMIENGDVELSDDLLFQLIDGTPAWLGTKPFLKRIVQWQYIVHNAIFDPEEQNAAEDNLRRIGTVLVPKGQKGRPNKWSNTRICNRYFDLNRQISDIFKKYDATSTAKLGRFLADYPDYRDCFDLRGKRHPRSPKEIAITIMNKKDGIPERSIWRAIAGLKPTRKGQSQKPQKPRTDK